MAVKLGGDLGGGKSQNYTDNSDINVTPFVDIMLVLLIIFMVAAPLATVSIPVDLPPSDSTPIENPKDPVYISIQKEGKIFLGDNEVTLSNLGAVIKERTQGDTENRIMVRADKQVLYGNVMQVMNVLQDNGYFKVALVAEEVVD